MRNSLKKFKVGQTIKNNGAEDWSPWHMVRVLSISLFGDVEVIPVDRPERFKPHTFLREEAQEKLDATT